jgi:hypothetical protein
MAIGSSCTITEETYGSVKKIKFAWATLSSSSGGVTAATTKAYNGGLERLVTIPGAGGSAPTASYDITVTDQDSTDALMGAGANRHTANTEQVNAASLGVVANDTLTINVTNAGSSNAGTAILYIR